MAYYMLHNLHKMPSEWVNLPLKEKVLIQVLIEEKVKREKRHGNRK